MRGMGYSRLGINFQGCKSLPSLIIPGSKSVRYRSGKIFFEAGRIWF
jgi:hypothetical protein